MRNKVKTPPVISFIGRPNVGKSSLFNRLMKKAHKAITYDSPGVTRDRHYGLTIIDSGFDFPASEVILVDTGGFYPDKIDEKTGKGWEQKKNKFYNLMIDQASMVMDESDLVLLVLDLKDGLTPYDIEMYNFIRKKNCEVWAIVNKYDHTGLENDTYEFLSLGLDEDKVFNVSAAHGIGVSELEKQLHIFACKEIEESNIMSKGVVPGEKVLGEVAIIGAPNAGKSTLLNYLVGSERALVSDIAGTTVDPIEGYFDVYLGDDAKGLTGERIINDDEFASDYERYVKELGIEGLPFTQAAEDNKLEIEQAVFSEESEEDVPKEIKEGNFWRSIKIVDTAGIRKKSQVKGFIEGQSVYRSLKSITMADVVVCMVNSERGMTHQDRRLCDIALDKGKAIVIAINKVDLCEYEEMGKEQKKLWLEKLLHKSHWLDFCTILPISAKEGTNLKRLKRAIKEILVIRNKKVPTGRLNAVIEGLVDRNPVHIKGGKGIFKVKYAAHVKCSPPTFMLFCNRSLNIPENFRRYLQNGLRSELKLKGNPVHLLFKTGKDFKGSTKRKVFELDTLD